MPEVKVQIGGRDYTLACEPGEETQLQQAAALLDAEATTLQDSIGRVPEPRMLLMAGLMLADRTTEIAQRFQSTETEIANLKAQLRLAETKGISPPVTQAPQTSAADRQAIQDAQAGEQAALAALERATQKIESLADQAG